MSEQLMRYDPATGTENPYPSHAKQYRQFKGDLAWLFDPWTGARRNASDVGSDLHGLLIVPDGEPAPDVSFVVVNAGALKALRDIIEWFDAGDVEAARECACRARRLLEGGK